MSLPGPGAAIERVLSALDAQPAGVQAAAGVLLGLATVAGGLAVFVLTLLVLVEYFQ
jgi:hypothetical protein